MAEYIETNKNAPPVRLFKSNFLEFFSHIHPLVVLGLWLPVAGLFMALSIYEGVAVGFFVHIPLAFLLGVFFWTLAEYLLHRFVFHFHAKTKRLQRITYLFHGLHHEQPLCKTRLVMPPVVSLPLAALFFLLFYLVLVTALRIPLWLYPMFSGFVIGYLLYDMIHYGTHHFKVQRGPFYYLKRYHMLHHFKAPQKRFGVSSPFWDLIFFTKPKTENNVKKEP